MSHKREPANERELAAIERLRGGVKCMDCEDMSVIVYCTGHHGDWYMCQKHDDQYQEHVRKVDKKYGL